jgi:putative SOS response-associated peptidase YedK
MSIGARMINARGEELAEKPAFRKALASRRCIVPVSGFYEWKLGTEGTGRKAAKQPMYIRPVADEVFGLAGLWETWRQPEGDVLKTFTIITVPANDALGEFHDRMPAILTRDAEDVWLDPDVDAVAALAVLRSAPAEEMEIYPVTNRVNSVGIDDPTFVERIADVPMSGTLTLDL